MSRQQHSIVLINGLWMTALKEFPERTHFTLGQKGWEEVADYALDWALAHASNGS